MLNYFYENIGSNLNFNGLYRYIAYASSSNYIEAPACYTRSSKRQAAGRCACVHARQRASARASIGKQQVHGREQKELFLFSSLVISFAGACAYSWLFCRSSGFRV